MPLVWMVSTSLKPEFDVFVYPPQLIPVRFRWQNYVDIFAQTRVRAAVPEQPVHRPR